MVFRKSDVRKKGKTRGWELILSHDFTTGITSGYCKGTPTSNIEKSINQLQSCASDVGHAMLLPLLILGNASSAAADLKQRNTREWLRRLEHAIAMQPYEAPEDSYYKNVYGIDLPAINRDLVECQAYALWNRPVNYLSAIESMEEAAPLFLHAVPKERKSPRLQRFHRQLLSRLHLYRERWLGIETYADTTMQRIDISRSSVRPASPPFSSPSSLFGLDSC